MYLWLSTNTDVHLQRVVKNVDNFIKSVDKVQKNKKSS